MYTQPLLRKDELFLTQQNNEFRLQDHSPSVTSLYGNSKLANGSHDFKRLFTIMIFIIQ